MKHFLLSLFMLPAMLASGQKLIPLDYVQKGDTIKNGQAVIYGNFVQRLGFSSGGFPQEISIWHQETGVEYSFRVKSTFKSKKEDYFCVHLPPGRYVLLNYHWTQSKWYGAAFHVEPVLKNMTPRQLQKMRQEGTLREEDIKRYEFTVAPNTVSYLGTWNFEEEGMPRFSDEKQRLDETVQKVFSKIRFDNAAVLLPQ